MVVNFFFFKPTSVDSAWISDLSCKIIGLPLTFVGHQADPTGASLCSAAIGRYNLLAQAFTFYTARRQLKGKKLLR